MCSFRKKLSAAILLLAAVSLSSHTCAAKELTYVGQTSRDVSVLGTSGAGVSGQSVSLYTGQHTEVFPLVSLPVRGLGSVDIALSYSGNVAQQAKRSNREAQASWVGLGFNLGFEVITCDHNSTADINDDRYFYSDGAGSSFEILVIPRYNGSFVLPEMFVASNGANWKFTRVQETVNGRPQVTGWIITKEDGTTYKYGDFNNGYSGRNATGYLLRWGGFVGNGTTAPGDELFPNMWAISRIEDNSSNYVAYTYEQTGRHLILNMLSSLWTTYEYTQAMYLKTIECSGGYSAEFVLESRTDYQDFLPGGLYEFYQTKRLGAVIKKLNGVNLEKVVLTHGYLGTKTNYEKLILEKITRFDGDGELSLPPTSFAYVSSPSTVGYGSISNVYYPGGGSKIINYAKVADEDVETVLNFSDDNNYEGTTEVPEHAVTRNTILSRYHLDGEEFDRFRVGRFNGYWDFRELDDLNEIRADSYWGSNFTIAAGDEYAVLYHTTTHKFVTLEWNSGTWVRDTLTPSWSLPTSSDKVNITAGKDMFIVSVLDARWDDEDDYYYMVILSAYLYKKRANGWTEHHLYSSGDWKPEFGGVKLGNDLYGISLVDHNPDNMLRQVLYGKYVESDIGVGSIISGYSGYHNWLRFVVGLDYVAWRYEDNGYLHIWSNASGSWGLTEISTGEIHSLAALENIIVFTTPDMSTPAFLTVHREPDGWVYEGCYNWVPCTEGSNTIVASTSSNKFILKKPCDPGVAYELLEFNGYQWISNYVFTIAGDAEYKFYLTDDICLGYRTSARELWVKRNLGNCSWSQTIRLNDEIAIERGDYSCIEYYNEVFMAGARNMAMVWGNEHYNCTPKGYMYTWDDWTNKWDTTNLVNYIDDYDGSVGVSRYLYPYNGRSYVVTPSYGLHGFQTYDDQFVGKPNLTVVSSVEIAPDGDPDSPDNIISTYSYEGGILDEAVNTPRFSKTVQSTPRRVGDASPDGYIAHRFYNDQPDDIDGFGDLDYMLDGAEYMAYSYKVSESEGLTTCLDSSLNYYSVNKISGLGSGIYRVQLDASHVRKDKLATDISYGYDQHPIMTFVQSYSTPQRVSTRTKLAGSGEYLLDSTHYAYWDDAAMELDNALVQVGKQITLYERNDFDSMLSIDGTEYEDLGDWKTVGTYTYRQLNPLSDKIYTSKVVSTDESFDQFGNRVSWTNANGDTSCVKYDAAGARVVAKADNCYLEDFLVQDFEQGDLWDDWNWALWRTYIEVDSSDVFTGRYSYKMHDNVTAAEKSWGAAQVIEKEKLTGDMYYFSCWAKSNWIPMIYCWCSDSTGALITNGYKYKSFIDLEADTWRRLEGVFDLSDLNWDDLHQICVQFVMADNPEDGSYVNYDDFRFHPLDALVSTKTFDPITGQMTSESGIDNIPAKYSYDEFMRLLTTTDYRDNTLLEKEYRFENTWTDTTITAEMIYPSQGTTSSQFVLEKPQNVHYSLYGNALYLVPTTTEYDRTLMVDLVKPEYDYCPSNTYREDVIDHAQTVNYSLYLSVRNVDTPSKTVVRKNGVAQDSIYVYNCDDNTCGPYSRSGSFSANTGDVIRVEVCGGENVMTDEDIITWSIRANVDYTELVTKEGEGYAQVLKNGAPVAEVRLTNGSNTKTGEFSAEAGDIVKVKTYVYTGSAANQNWTFTADATCEAYVPDDPNYVKTVTHNASGSPNVTMTFYDGLGRALQTRTLDSLSGAERAIVSGVAEQDARGRTVRSYKTYQDLWGATGVADYSPLSTALSEVNQYYDADGPGADCGGYPYSQNVYTAEVNSKLHQSAGPGGSYCLDSGHAVTYEQETDVTTEEYIGRTFDQDGLETGSVADRWGEYTRSYSFLDNDSVITISCKDKLGRDTAVYIDTSSASGADPIPLRKAEYNDLGQTVSTWKVDYGTIRMIYDGAGNLRFMQNDKRLSENNFVYYKYDAQGRKIEEGLMDGADVNFTQGNAYDRGFPDTLLGYEPEVKYRWYYDYYDNGDSLIVAPGKLVRAEDHKGLYYKEFYHYPEEYYDVTIVRMPYLTLALKAIRHDYNFDGSLRQMTIYPHWPDDSDMRVFSYEYDNQGRLKAIVEEPGADEYIRHAEYEYGVDGSLSKKMLGQSHLKVGPAWYDVLTAVVDYQYDPRGLLAGMDDPAQVLSALSGGGDIGDHFGLKLDFTYGDSPYYNGRLRRLEAGNSAGDMAVFNYYTYTYNDLGWLRTADNTVNDDLDREYQYNRLGMRKALTTATDFIEYVYDDVEPGSSKLQWFTGMGSYEMKYDVLGNMISDSSRSLYEIWYDYRNLINEAKMSSAAHDLLDWVEMTYDETGQRILKNYRRAYWYDCTPDPNPKPNQNIESALPENGEASRTANQVAAGDDAALDAAPKQWCPGSQQIKTYYLYDNGVLLATFDTDDQVIDVFVNGPDGMVASYHENNQDLLYYYQTDQIGSPRVIMLSPGGSSDPEVAQYLNYHPFGEVSQSYGSYDSPFKFTGKECDNERDFKFHYFGARYLDTRIGMFTSIDKASQFANGYLYGANNPILGADPDGQFWQVFLIGAVTNAFWYTAPYISARDFSGFNVGSLAAQSAVGGLTSGISAYGRPDHLLLNVTYSVGQSTISTTLNSAAAGRWPSGLGYSALIGAAQGVLTSQHFDNLLTGHGFRSYDSEIGQYLNRAVADPNNVNQKWAYAARAYAAEKYPGLDLVSAEQYGGIDLESPFKGYHSNENGAVYTGAGMFNKVDGQYLYKGGSLYTQNLVHEYAHVFLPRVDEHYRMTCKMNFGIVGKAYRSAATKLSNGIFDLDQLEETMFSLIDGPAFAYQLGHVRTTGLALSRYNAITRINCIKDYLPSPGVVPYYLAMNRASDIIPWRLAPQYIY